MHLIGHGGNMKLTRKELRKTILLEMQNYSQNNYSRYYPKLAQLLLSPEHEALVQAIELGETLKVLRLKSSRPGHYNRVEKTYEYNLNLKHDFAEYLYQNYPNPPQNIEAPYHYIRYDLNNASMSISIHTEFR